MSKKQRIGLQIRFNTESEADIVDFFTMLKKSEVHITAVSAFRMYMRSVGFYDRRRVENGNSLDALQHDRTRSPGPADKKADAEGVGLVDQEAFQALDSMFDNENGLNG